MPVGHDRTMAAGRALPGVVQESAKLADAGDGGFVVARNRDQVEHPAAGVDVLAHERSDVLGRPVRRVALKALEWQLVEGLHRGGERLAGGVATVAET